MLEVNEAVMVPRDFIYIDQQKLDSFFSQLFGGLIQSVDMEEAAGQARNFGAALTGGAMGNFGLGKGASKLAGFIFGHLGSMEASLSTEGNVDIERSRQRSTSTTFRRTLKHFQFALVEQSL